MQRPISTAGRMVGPPGTTTTGREDENKPDKSIKGPALASRSHTVQILVMLSLNSLLVFMCLYVLPAHLLWRQALKSYHMHQEEVAAGIYNNTTTTIANSALLDTIVAADATSNSSIRNLIAASREFFKASQKDVVALAGIQKAMKSSLAAAALCQGWFVARYKRWWDEAEAMERGDRDEVLKRRKLGIYSRMEEVTVTTFALPIPVILIFFLLILCGAPITRNYLDTLVLSAYLVVLGLFASCTFLGTDEKEWIDAFSFSSAAKYSPRFRLLAMQVTCTLLGALIGSAGHLLDWERAWQVYPVPAILGSCLGLIIGNGLGFFAYYHAVVPNLRRVELRAKSASASTSQSKKNKKKKR